MGTINLFMGMTCGVISYFFVIDMARSFSDAFFLSWPFCTLLCGIMYPIGGAFVRWPNRPWEITIMICAALQVINLLVLMGWLIFANFGKGGIGNSGWYWALFFAGLHAMSAGIVFHLMLRIRRDD
jgi:hypothetical protein